MVRSIVLGQIFLTGLFLVFSSTAHSVERVFEVSLQSPVIWCQTPEGFWSLNETSDFPASVGHPELSWRVINIGNIRAVFQDFKLEILEADTVAVPGLFAPHSPDMWTSDTATYRKPVLPDPTIYGQDSWYPQEPIRVEAVGQFGMLPVMSLAWCPYRYNPQRHQLIAIRRALIRATSNRQSPVSEYPIDTVPITNVLIETVTNSITNAISIGAVPFAAIIVPRGDPG